MSPALADHDGAVDDAVTVEGELLGGLLGDRGLLGSSGGLLPSLLGGHSTVSEFNEGTGELVEGFALMGELVNHMGDAPLIGGEHMGEGSQVGGGLLGGLLGGDGRGLLGGLTGGLLGRI
jgi:hypothetical protein